MGYIDRPSVSNRDLAIEMRKQFPGIVFDQRQLRNCRHRLRKKANQGYIAFPATMKLLDDAGVHYTVKWSASDDRKPEALFWTTDWSRKQWAMYQWVQLYDNTYKTNNKGLALFQVVGLNHMGMAFSCGFGLINNERKEGFD